MPGGGSSQTSSQTTSSGPWPAAQPYLKGILGDAKDLYKSGTGFEAYGTGNGKKPWTEFSDQTNSALGTMQGLASQPNPFYQGQSQFNSGLLNGQFNLDQSGYQNLMGNNPNAIAQYGTGIASGAQGIGTEGDYRAMLNGENDAYNQVRQNTANTLGDQIQRQFGGASYGSASNADYLTKGVGNVLSQMDSNNYFQRQGLKQGLLNDITGVQGQNISNRLNAAGMLSGEQQGAFSNNRGLLGDMSNLSNLDIQNRLQGLDRADSTYNSQYLPAQMMAGVGGAYDAKNQQILDAKMNKYNTNNMAPWDRLSQYFGIASGTGAQGQRATTTTSQPTDIWSKLLGGGLLASQLF